VLFVAGEVREREGELTIADDAQVRLDAAFEDDAGLGFTLRHHLEDAGVGGTPG
jgi:hypothetical protein